MDRVVEKLIYHIAEIVEIRRDAVEDIESNRHRWTECEIEQREGFIAALGLAIEGLDTLKCQIRDALAEIH